MLRALRGEAVDRPPVWMMRQAGRYMKVRFFISCFFKTLIRKSKRHSTLASAKTLFEKRVKTLTCRKLPKPPPTTQKNLLQVYQDLCKKHKTFRERSENADVAVEVSLQPWRAFKPDGVILFSDILTPLTGMNIPFDILAGSGPVIHDPIRTMEQVKRVTPLVGEEATPYVGEALRALRQEVGNASTVLGFVGAPFTLATYIVEGGSSNKYTHIKRLAHADPAVLHALCEKLAEGIADYVRYQADAGAQVVQIFDSWASELAPQDYDVFAAPYTKKIIDSVKKT